MIRKPGLRARPAAAEEKAAGGWLVILTWGMAVLMTLVMVYVLLQRMPIASAAFASTSEPQALAPAAVEGAPALPEYQPAAPLKAVARLASPHTIIPDRPRQTAIQYTVQKGDSVFSIATDHDLQPESVLWANYEVLKDDPEMLELGLTLNIPPADGVYYKWREGDSIQGVADRYKVKADAILSWPANRLDMTNPVVAPGSYVMVPEGKGEFRQWVVPTIPRGPAGVSTGFNTCDTSNSVGYGTGSFVWPAPSNGISGNDYWGGHLGIDIGAGMGQYIYAADSGVVVYASAIGGGYGNMVMIDHGNGYQTLYAHLSQINTRCGASVSQGSVIALAGSTGNSTGPHLHFEVRYMGGFINPWTVLP